MSGEWLSTSVGLQAESQGSVAVSIEMALASLAVRAAHVGNAVAWNSVDIEISRRTVHVKAWTVKSEDHEDKRALDELTDEVVHAMDFLDGPGGQWLRPGTPTREEYAREAAAHIYWHANYRPNTA